MRNSSAVDVDAPRRPQLDPLGRSNDHLRCAFSLFALDTLAITTRANVRFRAVDIGKAVTRACRGIIQRIAIHNAQPGNCHARQGPGQFLMRKTRYALCRPHPVSQTPFDLADSQMAPEKTTNAPRACPPQHYRSDQHKQREHRLQIIPNHPRIVPRSRFGLTRPSPQIALNRFTVAQRSRLVRATIAFTRPATRAIFAARSDACCAGSAR